MVKRILLWLFVAFLIFFIAYRPADAANVVRSLAGGLADIGRGIAEFFSSLVT